MSRYTRKSLEHDIVALNEEGKANGHTTHLVVGVRNGYAALDEYTVNPNNRSVCIRTIDCAVPPRQLLEKARYWATGPL